MNDSDLITGLDACRVASDDLRQPELRAVAEQVASDRRAHALHVRIERIDVAVSRTMHDVALPQGVAERLVARLREAAHGDAIGNIVDAQVSPALIVQAPIPGRTSHSRRKWLAWSAALATTAAAVIAGAIFFYPEKPLTGDDLEASRQWHNEIAASHKWRSIEPDELEPHALPRELRHYPTRYQDASSVVGREARAYDLTLPGGPPATLFVIPQEDRAGVPSSAPTSLATSTLGLGVACWQTGGHIYVVVLQSDRREDYQRLLRTVSSTAA